jgi:prefoldin subunit 5
METLKNNKSKMNNSIAQINISFKSLANRVEQIDNRVSGTKTQSRGIRPNSKRS